MALFFDTLEEAVPETFTWVQEHILVPALEEGQVFIAMAARAHYQALNLKGLWPVLRKMEIRPLRPFDREDVQIQARLLGMQPLEDITLYTGGVPGIKKKVVLEKSYQEKATLPDKAVEIIFTYIAEKVEEVKDILLVMAAFRWFNDRLLAHIAHCFWPDRYQDSRRRTGNRLARKMLATWWVGEHPQGYGYTVAPELRPVLDRYHFSHHPQQHLETHRLAFQWFKQEVAAGDWESLVDQVYHLSAAWYDRKQNADLAFPEDLPLAPTTEERVSCLRDLLSRGLEGVRSEEQAKARERICRSLEEGEEFRSVLDQTEIEQLVAFVSQDGAATLAKEQNAQGGMNGQG
ncbi:hypothetical protein D6833_09075 [Candidatus Parcubacteria bacterium]|nr:MAG: hypothetical protein D6833_09075 [Candidatus Parcubacteria bacterium]